MLLDGARGLGPSTKRVCCFEHGLWAPGPSRPCLQAAPALEAARSYITPPQHDESCPLHSAPLSRRKDKGGVSFSSTVKEPKVDLEAAKAVCAEYRIHNADIFMADVRSWGWAGLGCGLGSGLGSGEHSGLGTESGPGCTAVGTGEGSLADEDPGKNGDWVHAQQGDVSCREGAAAIANGMWS